MTVFCNLCLLSAMSAGRAESGSWTWALSLFAEILTLTGAALASLFTFSSQGQTVYTFILFVGSLAVGFLVSGGLAFLEYAAFGRRSQFRSDLRNSLWISKTGTSRL